MCLGKMTAYSKEVGLRPRPQKEGSSIEPPLNSRTIFFLRRWHLVMTGGWIAPDRQPATSPFTAMIAPNQLPSSRTVG